MNNCRAHCLRPALGGWDVRRAKPKTHEASRPLPTGNVPARTHTGLRRHTLYKHTFTSPAFVSVLSLPFVLAGLLVQIRPSLAFWCATLTLSSGYDITPLPHGVFCADMVDSEALEVHRTAQQRLRGLLGQSHIQASAVFYVPPFPLSWKNIGEFHSHYCGTLWVEVRGQGRAGQSREGRWMPSGVGVTSYHRR